MVKCSDRKEVLRKEASSLRYWQMCTCTTRSICGSRECSSRAVMGQRFYSVMQTTLSVALGGKKKRNTSTVSGENVCESSDWNWRRTKRGSSRSVVIAREKQASTF